MFTFCTDRKKWSAESRIFAVYLLLNCFLGVHMTTMASDYIYIFCIPGSGSSETCSPSGFSTPAPLENGRVRSAAVCPRTSAHARPTNSSTDSSNNSNISRSMPTVGCSRPISRPQSAFVDVPEDRAPLPARQRSGRGNLNRASFPGTTGTQSSRQPNAELSASPTMQPSFVEDSFLHDTRTLPTYAPHPNRSTESSRDIAPSSFYALRRFSPRATSSPVRQNRRGLCDMRAKACWRRVFNRECCLHCVVTVTTFRWLLLFFASVGAGCILSGVVLGVLYVSLGTSFLVLSVMFMGLGVMLIVVIGVGWRCTPAGHEPCHLLFNLDQLFDVSRSQRDGQTNRCRDRSLDQNQWFGGMIYPEFRSRTPPPTYTASVMEYDDRCWPRSLSCEAVEMFPASVAVDPVPATPPPSYQGRGRARGMPVYCPRALRTRPAGLVANDSSHPATSVSTSAVVVVADPSNETGVVGKWMPGVGRGVVSARSHKSSEPSTSLSQSNDASHVAGCSSDVS